MNGRPRGGRDNKGYLFLRILANIKVAMPLIRCLAVVIASSHMPEHCTYLLSLNILPLIGACGRLRDEHSLFSV